MRANTLNHVVWRMRQQCDARSPTPQLLTKTLPVLVLQFRSCAPLPDCMQNQESESGGATKRLVHYI